MSTKVWYLLNTRYYDMYQHCGQSNQKGDSAFSGDSARLDGDAEQLLTGCRDI